MTQGGVKTGLITEYHYLHCNHYPPSTAAVQHSHQIRALVSCSHAHTATCSHAHTATCSHAHTATCSVHRAGGSREFQTQGQDSGHLPTQRPACYCVTFFRQPLFLGLSHVGQIALSMETREADLKLETCG